MSNTGKTVKKGLRIVPKNPALIVLMFLDMLVAMGFMAMLVLVDAFPKNLVAIMLAVLVVMLVLAIICMNSRKHKAMRIIGVIISLVMCIAFGLGTYYLHSTYEMFSRVTADNSVDAKSVDVTKDSFNVYFTGIDQWDSEKGEDLERSDVNMIATVNPKTKKVLLTSMSRDSYIELNRTGTMDKLTHTGIYGVDETLKSVEGWLGYDMNYYVKVNFDSVIRLIDAIGGIDVYSPVAFKSDISDYKYKKGWNHLTGRAALYFARERHAFEKGDQARIENQQRIMKAIIKKLTTSTAVISSYGKLMDVVADNVETNMSSQDMMSLVKMQLADMAPWDITSQTITGTVAQRSCASLSSANVYDVVLINEDSLKKAEEGIDKVLNPTAKELKKAETAKEKRELESFVDKLKFWEK